MNCKWIFKTKYNANGFVARTKVHLATMGFSQVEDINFNATLSPIAQMESIQNLFIVTTIQIFQGASNGSQEGIMGFATTQIH